MLENNILYTILLIAGLVLGAVVSHLQMRGGNDDETK